MKYYIEREDESWLCSLEDRGLGWTRNPAKAWTFDKGPGIPAPEPGSGGEVALWLWEEGLGNFMVKSHEFTETWSDNFRDSNGDAWTDFEGNGEIVRRGLGPQLDWKYKHIYKSTGDIFFSPPDN